MSKAPTKQSTDRINILNIWLMLLSGLLAFVWPFYLFLISYAFLGPLHYLTEISWLHDKGYYTKRKYDYLFLVAITLLYGSSLFIKFDQIQIIANAVLIAFIGSLALTLTSSLVSRIALVLAACVLGYSVPISYTSVIIGILILTIIHVFVFTGFFIAFGAIKSKSRTGYISLAVFIGIATVLLLIRYLPSGGVADTFVVAHYGKRFADPNIWIMKTFGFSTMGSYANDPFEFSAGAIAVMRFISFAYVYHYLNWFSKTKIIGWHEVSKKRLVVVGVIWIAAIVLYAIDFDLGFKALFFLSALHVLLEFPLDLRTIIGIGSEFGKRMKLRTLVPQLSDASDG
jgi:hypothetical protein